MSNAILLIINRSGSSETEILVIDILDVIFAVFFIVEMFIGIGVLGLSVYLRKKHIDIFTNFLGIIEVILTCTPYSKSKIFTNI